jgi:hypothetical protein
MLAVGSCLLNQQPVPSFRHNVLWLSQGKFSSHVVEQALCHADPALLRAMVDEILTGYETDE